MNFNKFESLKNYLKTLKKQGICLAFSGGIDSILLLNLCKDLDVVAITFKSQFQQKREMEFAKNHGAAVDNFLKEYKNSITFMTSPETVAEAANLTVTYGLLPNAKIATESIIRSNIVCIIGKEMQNDDL